MCGISFSIPITHYNVLSAVATFGTSRDRPHYSFSTPVHASTVNIFACYTFPHLGETVITFYAAK